MSFRKKNDEMLQPPPHPQYEIQPMGSRWSIYTNSDNMDDEDRGMVHQSTLVRAILQVKLIMLLRNVLIERRIIDKYQLEARETESMILNY